MAYRVQSSLIPEATPEIPGWEFAASWQPAREVSGDYYDFISGNEGILNLVIADVTDKGMPAALFMALTPASSGPAWIRPVPRQRGLPEPIA